MSRVEYISILFCHRRSYRNHYFAPSPFNPARSRQQVESTMRIEANVHTMFARTEGRSSSPPSRTTHNRHQHSFKSVLMISLITLLFSHIPTPARGADLIACSTFDLIANFSTVGATYATQLTGTINAQLSPPLGLMVEYTTVTGDIRIPLPIGGSVLQGDSLIMISQGEREAQEEDVAISVGPRESTIPISISGLSDDAILNGRMSILRADITSFNFQGPNADLTLRFRDRLASPGQGSSRLVISVLGIGSDCVDAGVPAGGGGGNGGGDGGAGGAGGAGDGGPIVDADDKPPGNPPADPPPNPPVDVEKQEMYPEASLPGQDNNRPITGTVLTIVGGLIGTAAVSAVAVVGYRRYRTTVLRKTQMLPPNYKRPPTRPRVAGRIVSDAGLSLDRYKMQSTAKKAKMSPDLSPTMNLFEDDPVIDTPQRFSSSAGSVAYRPPPTQSPEETVLHIPNDESTKDEPPS
ncbi:hypothetical protein BC832DRAFT_210260 [Gaertneriomyces semiglobifer]|nr:hypothetical protein BC832DRAFT_210260 [Gaertneriomyces semiglobifer]